MSPRSENPTVYSTESGRVCPNCGRPEAQCSCKKKSTLTRGNGVVRVQLESKGRAGKTVSRVTGLALDEEGLKQLAGELKRVCGSGGTVKAGVIEIQGDHRDTLVEALKKQGIKAKRV
jgi:translation initiation factor 1